MKVLYDTILKATYTGRPNRFVVTLDLNGESVLAHLPNPGRMWELLFTGVTMYIVPHDKPDAKTKYRVVGIERDGVVIMLDTNSSNDVAQHLIENSTAISLVDMWSTDDKLNRDGFYWVNVIIKKT